MPTHGAAARDERCCRSTRTETDDDDDDDGGDKKQRAESKKAKINCTIFFRIDLDDLFAFLIDDWEGRWEDNLHLWNRWTNEECGVPEDCWYCLLERAAEFL